MEFLVVVGFGCFHPWKLGLGLENVGFLPTCGTKYLKENLPETASSPMKTNKTGPKRKVHRIPTIHFEGRNVSFGEGICKNPMAR